MKNLLPIVLVLGGAAIAAIVGIGIKMTNTRSDAEVIRDTILEQRALDARQADDAAVLMSAILPVPESCAGLSTRFAFRICGGEPNAGNPWPDWTSVTAPEERTCILGAFHQTNAHAHRIQGSRYDMAEPDNERVSAFVSDLCAAVLWADDMTWGDDKPLGELIEAYYADRAESMIAPKRAY